MKLMEALDNIFLRKFESDKGTLLVEIVRILEQSNDLATIITARQYNSFQNKYSKSENLINYGYSAHRVSAEHLEDIVSLKEVLNYGSLVDSQIFDTKNGIVVSDNNQEVIVASTNHVYSLMSEKEKGLHDFLLTFNNVVSAAEAKNHELRKKTILRKIVTNTKILNDEEMFNVIKDSYEYQYGLNKDAKELQLYRKEYSGVYRNLIAHLTTNKGVHIKNDIESIFTQFSPDILIDSLIPKVEKEYNIIIDYDPDDELSVYNIPLEHKKLIIIENAKAFLNYDTKSTINATEITIEANYLALLKLAKNLKILPEFAISLGELDPHNDEWLEKTKDMN